MSSERKRLPAQPYGLGDSPFCQKEMFSLAGPASLATKQAPDESFVMFGELSVLGKTNHLAQMGFGTFKTDATFTNIMKQTCQKSRDKMQ